MIAAIGRTTAGGKSILIGLTDDTLRRLKEGKVIKVEVGANAQNPEMTVVLRYGLDDATIAAALKQEGSVTDQSKIIDRRCGQN